MSTHMKKEGNRSSTVDEFTVQLKAHSDGVWAQARHKIPQRLVRVRVASCRLRVRSLPRNQVQVYVTYAKSVAQGTNIAFYAVLVGGWARLSTESWAGMSLCATLNIGVWIRDWGVCRSNNAALCLVKVNMGCRITVSGQDCLRVPRRVKEMWN
ncbi:hypothetical protein IF1G_00347 [Cordyceps javanica]|uniref:Uncharacterized protein n=1 Tax=Cordyceps javanica TaxID=43265 RepID=A0A545VFD6_9HYPO|nr:hypothetical protein IF1G_00347 [Cordyceps javanica]